MTTAIRARQSGADVTACAWNPNADGEDPGDGAIVDGSAVDDDWNGATGRTRTRDRIRTRMAAATVASRRLLPRILLCLRRLSEAVSSGDAGSEADAIARLMDVVVDIGGGDAYDVLSAGADVEAHGSGGSPCPRIPNPVPRVHGVRSESDALAIVGPDGVVICFVAADGSMLMAQSDAMTGERCARAALPRVLARPIPFEVSADRNLRILPIGRDPERAAEWTGMDAWMPDDPGWSM